MTFPLKDEKGVTITNYNYYFQKQDLQNQKMLILINKMTYID